MWGYVLGKRTRVSGETLLTTSPIILASDNTPSRVRRPQCQFDIHVRVYEVLTGGGIDVRKGDNLVLLLFQGSEGRMKGVPDKLSARVQQIEQRFFLSLFKVFLTDSSSQRSSDLLYLRAISF